ncbi:MAG: ribonuclease HII [Dehalococcoidia bacterium]|nr:ribonuclease HII [Dehalococcoidia bacterium]MDW8119534.1 ribonuclease HII [Chloroflexota bacterium]
MARSVHQSRPTFAWEERLWRDGLRWVAGIDEAGRGPLAGPVVAAAVVFPPGWSSPWLAQVDDSKRLSPSRRASLAVLIRKAAFGVGVGVASVGEIDSLGILGATRRAMQRAISALPVRPQALLVDAVALDVQGIPCWPLVRGDRLSLSIAAASIIAKVERDALMETLDAQYPGYGFRQHKGYPTPAHLYALRRLGPCPAHRASFAPVRAVKLSGGKG